MTALFFIKIAVIIKKKEITIRIENSSYKEIKIIKIQPSCKCMVSNNFRLPLILRPNDKFDLKLTYKSEEKGNFLETIVILNDSDKPFEIINLKSNVTL